MKKLRKWLVEETGEIRQANIGETSFDENGFQSWHIQTFQKYNIVKVTEIKDKVIPAELATYIE